MQPRLSRSLYTKVEIMSFLPDNTDYLIEVARGNVPGASLVHKFGRNAAVPNGSFELISLLSSTASFLAAATTVRIKAGGNGADDTAGAGAQEITVVGIDDNLVEVTETIATAGASASSATTALFWRIYRIYVSAVGTYGVANTAAITLENSGGGTDLIMIATGEGQSQYGGFTIATATTGYLMSVLLTVDAAKAADVKMMTRANFNDVAAPMPGLRLKNYWDGILGTLVFKPRSPIVVSALTDIWFEAQGGGAGTEVSVDFELLLIDD